jgi:hypothetical protein
MGNFIGRRGDTASFQTQHANLSEEQLQSHWNELYEVLCKALPEEQKMAMLQRILPQIPPARRLELLTKTDQHRSTLLHWAAFHGNLAVCYVLLVILPDPVQRSAFMKQVNVGRRTALQAAIRKNKLDNAGLLLAYGADPFSILMPDRLATLSHTRN